ncbi:MAG: hypothetical protein ACI4F4_10840 [Lachnospiraceae bacterium]
MKYIFFLRHIQKFIDDKEYEQYEDFVLGYYSTKKKALEAVERYSKLPGFSKYPKKCFIIERWILDNDMTWKDGFIKSVEAINLRPIADRYDENTIGFDVSSWVMGKEKKAGETDKEFAMRLLNERYEDCCLDRGLYEEYLALLLWGEICFDN